MKPELQRRVQRYGWNKAAEYYDASWQAQLKPAQDMLMDVTEPKPGEKVLETACGTGLITFRIAQAVEPEGEVLATDISEDMVELAGSAAEERKIRNTDFQRMDAEELEVDDNTFDVAVCGLGLMYLPDPLKALMEMHRVLKPGGRAAVAIWGERKNCGWADIFPIVEKRVASDVCPMFFQQGTGDTLEHTFSLAGFDKLEVNRFKTDLHFKSPEHIIMAAFSGGPVALAYNKFDEETRDGAHQEYLDSIAHFKNGSGYQIPGEFVVARGLSRD
ncbi:MAG: class I SAM-dependent methyltransferase [Cyclonatronaceae bacterium]